MKPVTLLPRVHLFVCENRREEGSPLGPGCGDEGSSVYTALKEEVARQGTFRAVWVTSTRCLGICPKRGTTVAAYPRQAIFTEVVAGDAAGLYAMAVEA